VRWRTETWGFTTTTSAQPQASHPPFTITYARRTLAGWLSAVLGAGLVIEAITEPHADEETAAAHLDHADALQTAAARALPLEGRVSRPSARARSTA
jgi:hypothetical protein